MSRLGPILNAYVKKSKACLEKNKDSSEHFAALIVTIETALKIQKNDTELYNKILKNSPKSELLLAYYKEKNPDIREAVNNFLTILLCYELIARVFNVKYRFREIFKLDDSSLSQFVILKEDSLKFLPKKIMYYIKDFKRQIRTKEQHRTMSSTMIGDQVTTFLSFLSQENLLESADDIQYLVISKLGLNWYKEYQAKRLPLIIKADCPQKTPPPTESEEKSTTIKPKTHPNFPLSWHPLRSTFMLGWQAERQNASREPALPVSTVPFKT